MLRLREAAGSRPTRGTAFSRMRTHRERRRQSRNLVLDYGARTDNRVRGHARARRTENASTTILCCNCRYMDCAFFRCWHRSTGQTRRYCGSMVTRPRRASNRTVRPASHFTVQHNQQQLPDGGRRHTTHRCTNRQRASSNGLRCQCWHHGPRRSNQLAIRSNNKKWLIPQAPM